MNRKALLTCLNLLAITLFVFSGCTKKSSTDAVSKTDKSNTKLEKQIEFYGIVGTARFSNNDSSLAMKFKNVSGKEITKIKGSVFIYDDYDELQGEEKFDIDSSVKYYENSDSDGIDVSIPDQTSFIIVSNTWTPYFKVISEEAFQHSIDGGFINSLKEGSLKTKYSISGIVFSDGSVLKKE